MILIQMVEVRECIDMDMNPTTRRKIQIRCRKLLKKYGDLLPPKGTILEDEEFKIKYIGHSISFGDCDWKFEVTELKTGTNYKVSITDFIRSETPYWHMEVIDK